MESCILVATDGESQALAALKFAGVLSARTGRPLEIVSACEPIGVFGYESPNLVAGVQETIAHEACSRREARVRDQLRLAGLDAGLPVHVPIGAPAPSIARLARERGAGLILTGPGDHSMGDRMLHDETALRLIQLAQVPVLTVPADRDTLPSSILVAIDFTSFSLDAAWASAGILTPGGELHLAHVLAGRLAIDHASQRESEWMRSMTADALGRLELLADRIRRVHPRIRVTVHLLEEARPAPALLRAAAELGVEMLASGTNGYGFLGRLLMGSVATQLVRRSNCLTLIAPPRRAGAANTAGRHMRGGRLPRRTLPLLEPMSAPLSEPLPAA